MPISATQGQPERSNAGSLSPTIRLRRLIEERKVTIGIIGLGYVGLPLALTFHESGFCVTGHDVDPAKIEALQRGQSYIHHIPQGSVQTMSRTGRFHPSASFQDLASCEVIVICLPTPLGRYGQPDMSFVTSAVRKLGRVMRRPALVVLESTTFPTGTESCVVDILRDEFGIHVGEDVYIAFSPEREDPGNCNFRTKDIPKLVGGVDKDSGHLAAQLYRSGGFADTVVVSSARVAECAKLLENTYRAVNIALVNELKGVFREMDVDIWEVLDAAGTKPFGYQRFNPGPGVGGHCIPVDPMYLAWKAREFGTACSFIELAAHVNADMPSKVVARVQYALNEERKPVNGAEILLLGIAYKPDVDDIRCAPSLDVWEQLRKLGASVSYHDPYVVKVCHTRKHDALTGARSTPIGRDVFRQRKFDAIVVLTNHSCFGDLDVLSAYEGPVIDTRNCISQALRAKIKVIAA